MPIMAIVIIFAIVYFAVFSTMLVYQKQLNPKYTIATFTTVNLILLLGVWLFNYFERNKFEFFLLDQISPCMFTLLVFSYFLKDEIKDVFYSTAAYFSTGMLLAMLLSPGATYIQGGQENDMILYTIDILQHLNFSLFGIYLVLSQTAKINAKSFRNSLVFIFSIISFVLVINFVFHQNFFGLGYYSDFGIYTLDLFDSYWLTLLVYLAGVFTVVILGFGVNKLLLKCNGYNKS